MQNKLKLLLVAGVLSSVCSTSYANTYNSKLQDLQNQINELKAAQTETASNISLLDGLYIGGRLHINGTWTDAENGDSSTLKVNRARITVNKMINDVWEGQIQVGFAGNSVYLEENYIGYHFDEYSSLKLGNIFLPGFIEREKSSDHMATILYNSSERLGWTPYYGIGLNYAYRSDTLGASVGVFGNSIEHENKNGNYTKYNTMGRVWYSVVNTDEAAMMVGVNGMYQQLNTQGTATMSYTNQELEAQSHMGLELLAQWGSVTAVAEYMLVNFDFDNPAKDDVNTSALTAEVMWNVTGETSVYDAQWGVYGGVDPMNPVSEGGMGAVQLVARYSYANGKVGYLTGTQDYTVGVNWIPEKNVKLLLGY